MSTPTPDVDAFVELVRLLLPVSSLSAHQCALIRQDVRSLQAEARRDLPRPAVIEALMASVVDDLAEGVSALGERTLRARLPRRTVSTAPA
jgi:hypothetical protein